ncbi:MAG: sugar ABC transporter permease [Chloroflexota bacterium]|nr:sugar ABC transporter permease [Chloroflexota bacterium]
MKKRDAKPNATRLSIHASEEKFALALVTPAFLITFLIVLIPLLYALYLSFNRAEVLVVGGQGGLVTEFRGLKNYFYFLSSPDFWYSVRTTLYFTVASLIIELVLGIMVALLLNEEFWGRGVVRTLLILPWAVPTVVNARMWGLIFEPHAYGALNGLLQTLHLLGPEQTINYLAPIPLFQNAPLLGELTSWLGITRGLTWIIVGDTWKTLPVVALLLLAGLQAIPLDLYRAAKVDGANAWQRFWLITLPLLRPIILIVLVYRTMELFRVFDIIYILMAYTIPVLGVTTFQQSFVFGNFGKGSAIAFLIGLLVLLLANGYIHLINLEERE